MRTLIASVVVAGLALGSSVALARTVNNCDINTGTLCYKAELSGAKLAGSELALSNFSCADPIHADLSEADLRGARFEDATLAGTELGRANVEGCIGCSATAGRKP